MSTATAQPYLNWLDLDMDPPAWLSLKGWQTAAGELIGRMRTARNQLLSGDADWDAVEAMLLAEGKFETLNLWAEHTHERTPRLHRSSFARTELRLRAAKMRLLRSSARSRAIHVLRGWLRRRKMPLNTEQKRLVREIIEQWKDAVAGKLRPETERLAARHFRRAIDYSQECRQCGLWLSRRQAQELPPLWRRQARATARSMGHPGWFVAADGELADEAMAAISDRGVREALWRQRQALRESDKTIVPMLRARHEEAGTVGHTNFASYNLSNRTLTSTRMITGLLAEHMEKLGAAIRRLDKRLGEEAALWDIHEVSPWDRPFLLEQMRRKMRFHEEPANVFHVDRTLEMLIPEILALGGWTVEHALLHGEGPRRRWQYRLRRADNATAQIWLAPFATKDEEDLNVAASCAMVRHPWNGEGQRAEAMAVIEMALVRGSQYFNHQQLVWLVHELGHALHYLAMRGTTSGEDTRFPDDMVEFPPQLLERYAQDPQVLARWAAGCGAAPITHRASFWRYHLATDVASIDIHLRTAYHAWLDLKVHGMNPENVCLDEIHRLGCERFGLPYHEDDRRHIRSFMWGDYAATDYAYPIGQALGLELVRIRDDGTIDAHALGETFRSLLDGVLTDGFEPRRLRRQWQQWRGEDLEVSVRRGMGKHSRLLRATTLSFSRLP